MTISYWLSEPSAPFASVTVNDPDVVVVGAGVTGCAAALRLAQAGKRVRLVDGREVAGGASGRNGGFALRGMPAAFDVTTESVGEDTASDLMAWTERAIDTIESLAGDAFRRVGSLRIAVDEEERDELTVISVIIRIISAIRGPSATLGRQRPCPSSMVF